MFILLFILIVLNISTLLLVWTTRVEKKWDNEDMKKWQASKSDLSPRKGYIPSVKEEMENDCLCFDNLCITHCDCYCHDEF